MNVVIFRFLAMCKKWYIFVQIGIYRYIRALSTGNGAYWLCMDGA